jgi:hypothetical protein
MIAREEEERGGGRGGNERVSETISCALYSSCVAFMPIKREERLQQRTRLEDINEENKYK